MGQASGSDNPKLLYSAVKSEQEGIKSLLCGIIGVYKNPQSHRFVGIEDKYELFEALCEIVKKQPSDMLELRNDHEPTHRGPH